MKEVIESLEAFHSDKNFVNAIIETQKGSAIKYSWSPKIGVFRAKRTLPHRMVFPFNFGFIPSTRTADGDPLDILIINQEPFVCGCLLKVQLLAVIQAEQSENGGMVRKDRIVGTALDEETPAEFLLTALDDARVKQIVFFFASYNRINGKVFRPLPTGNANDAEIRVREAAEGFGGPENRIAA